MITVTAGLLVDEDQILIAKRSKNSRMGQKWEFPGGKVKQGESPEECLIRELKEELNIEVSIEDFLSENIHVYDWGTVRLLAYYVRWKEGEIEPRVHERVKWARIDNLHEYDFLSADIPLIKKLMSHCD